MVVAYGRLLVQASRRGAESFKGLGLNNLFLCVLFLSAGSHGPRTAFWSALPFLLVVVTPMLAASSVDALMLVPPVRAALMPLTRAERAILAVAAVLLNPLLWALALVSLVWAGAAAFVAFVLLASSMQLLVGLARLVAGRRRRGRSTPSARVTLGGFRGLVVIRLREIGTTLDLWSAVFFAVAGVSYQLLARSPDAAARPVLALLIALTLSTLAQRTFALTGPGGVTRYRLLPLSGWRILLAYDAALLLVTVTLVAPFRLRAGLAAMLAAMAAGRWAAVRQQGWQRRWRFCGGDIRFGVAQVILGTLAGAGANAISNWFIVGAAALYLGSLALGDRWWRHPRPG